MAFVSGAVMDGGVALRWRGLEHSLDAEFCVGAGSRRCAWEARRMGPRLGPVSAFEQLMRLDETAPLPEHLPSSVNQE